MIENPILNSPYDEPTRHFEVVEGRFTENIVAGRRRSSYLIPVAKPRGSSKIQQLALPGQQVENVKPNEFVNEIRGHVRAWRDAGYPGTTYTTRTLLHYWNDPQRASRLFFAQIEAVETAIYLTEYAPTNRPSVINQLDAINRVDNEGLARRAFKMATGSGKTVVMSMLIAWQTLNKFSNPQDKRFSDAFLIVAPGITIRDRLQVLQPSEPAETNYYLQRDIVPPDLRERLGSAKIIITNFHAFQPRAEMEAGKLNKEILGNDLVESPAAMVRRVLRELGNKKNIVVINDEAHHCYLALERDADSGEEAKAARVWFAGLQAVQKKLGIRAVFDLSATPFYLSSSGRTEGTLFEWVVSDFDLTDAIESGLVKIPHTPVSDDTASEVPKYRAIWPHIKDELKHFLNARKDDDRTAPSIPGTLEGALKSLYSDYERAFALHRSGGGVPPVFVVVCNDTRTSKLVYDWLAGYDGFAGPVAGELGLFSNVVDGSWIDRPTTLLIDSRQLESGEGLSAAFRKTAHREIEEFREQYRRRTGRDDVEDTDILREVLNTVGKRGQLGENIRCVVSVSMLSEGWDANNVTHILGVRAFTTKLLCEQVIGRGLRRMWFAKEKEAAKYRRLFGPKRDSSGNYRYVELADGTRRAMTPAEKTGGLPLPAGSRIYQLGDTTSSRPSAAHEKFEVEVDGKRFLPGNRTWTTTQEGFARLKQARRLVPIGNTLRYVRYMDDFPASPIDTQWTDTMMSGFSEDKRYVVQTSSKVIERCILMTTDPGDLVLDPTCGGGTTAYCAEKWGRRWITIDTSRVALMLARENILSAKFPFYMLQDSHEGRLLNARISGQSIPSDIAPARGEVSKGFVLERVPRIGLKGIANNPEIKEGMSRSQVDEAIRRHAEMTYFADRPYVDKSAVRVSGPFTVESLAPTEAEPLDEDEKSTPISGEQGDFISLVIDNIRTSGIVNGEKGGRTRFTSVDPFPGEYINAVGIAEDGHRFGVAVGPKEGTVGPGYMRAAAREAMNVAVVDTLAVCGFAFESAATTEKMGNLLVLKVRMNQDMQLGDMLKKSKGATLFRVYGEPDVGITKDGEHFTVEVRGMDVYDPAKREVRSAGTDKIQAWFLDTNYDGERFIVRHVYFLGDTDVFDDLQRALKGEIDEEGWSSIYSAVSRPFVKPKTGKIAIKVITVYGDESVVVLKV